MSESSSELYFIGRVFFSAWHESSVSIQSPLLVERSDLDCMAMADKKQSVNRQTWIISSEHCEQCGHLRTCFHMCKAVCNNLELCGVFVCVCVY